MSNISSFGKAKAVRDARRSGVIPFEYQFDVESKAGDFTILVVGHTTKENELGIVGVYCESITCMGRDCSHVVDDAIVTQWIFDELGVEQ